ncbi:dUTP diphosphatase [Paenibacillus sp. BSR1-1]|uniref:dUTP diphosphatase n=1 Tax=Paenibacillus sp. BSR1-1 TaxID=3020845 RepID=UPI0025B0C82D|nr:dUTP diphosphatase [Paenibacillus sp. BSR1-1]MDN3018432.1 dUTP diphosphatase [Paenibacillus sp. BSR1-1]
MNLEKLFQMQKALDLHIEEKHQLQDEDLFSRKVLALLVEIGELANETRSFKFWSVKPSSAKDVILEEFVDGVHFILSLGIECGFDQQDFELSMKSSLLTVTDQFLKVYAGVSMFQTSKSIHDYVGLLEEYLELGFLLGITSEEMEQAYFHKNEVNYQRQQNNY